MSQRSEENTVSSKPEEKTRTLVLHPFAIALFPVIASLDFAKTTVPYEEVIPAAVAVEIFAMLLFVGLTALFKDSRKGGMATTTFLTLFFCYRFIMSLVTVILGRQQISAGWLELSLFILFAFWVISMITKDKWCLGTKTVSLDHSFLCMSFNFVSAFLLLLSIPPVIVFELKESAVQRKYINKFHELIKDLPLQQTAQKPDVYYIMLDAFANSRTLKDYYNYDNHEFTDQLTKKQLYVVDRAASNYDRTSFSLTSCLDMQYLDALPEELRGPGQESLLYERLIQGSCVIDVFRRLGYKIINVSSTSGITSDLPGADLNIHGNFINEFTVGLMLLTPLMSTEQYYPLISNLYAAGRLTFDRNLDSLIQLKGPKFVIAHVMLPHPPFLFDENGRHQLVPEPSRDMHELPNPYLPKKENFVGQVKFTQKLVINWVDKLLAQSGSKPIIIIHSDHGPFYYRDDKDLKLTANERNRILNCYYFPGMNNKGLYDSITPINSFRVLFNDYFGTALPIVKDSSYIYHSSNGMKHMIDVTDLLKFDVARLDNRRRSPIHISPTH